MNPSDDLAELVSYGRPGARTGFTLWREADDVRTYVAWGPILIKAAEALAASLGSKIGEGLGQAFVDALLGKDASADAFRAEVVQRLQRIEAKLDEVINFLRSEFPEIFKQLLREELTQRDYFELASRRAQVADAIAQLPSTGTPTEGQLQLLESAAIEVANIGDILLQRGPACYLAGVHALASMIAAYSRIAQVHPSKLKSLASRAERWAKLSETWTDPAAEVSFATLSTRMNQTLAAERSHLAKLPADFVTSVTKFLQDGVTGDGSSNLMVWRATARLGLDGVVGAEFQTRAPRWARVQNVDAFELDELARSLNLQIASWWAPRVLREYDVQNKPYEIGEAGAERIRASGRLSLLLPARIAEADSAVATINSFLQSCAYCAALRP